jgi:hypothetical protein
MPPGIITIPPAGMRRLFSPLGMGQWTITGPSLGRRKTFPAIAQKSVLKLLILQG